MYRIFYITTGRYLIGHYAFKECQEQIIIFCNQGMYEYEFEIVKVPDV